MYGCRTNVKNLLLSFFHRILRHMRVRVYPFFSNPLSHILSFLGLPLTKITVIELKVDKFKPEYAGKLNFYISAIDEQIRSDRDGSTIGILICKSKSDIKVEYSLRDLTKPIGVSEYLSLIHI